MPRIRTLKPEFWQDEKLALLDPLTRLVYLGLVSQADDAGRLLDNVKYLDGLLFPYTDDTCADALDTLANRSLHERERPEPAPDRRLELASEGGPPIQVRVARTDERRPAPTRAVTTR